MTDSDSQDPQDPDEDKDPQAPPEPPQEPSGPEEPELRIVDLTHSGEDDPAGYLDGIRVSERIIRDATDDPQFTYLRSMHHQAQMALLRRIIELAPSANVEDLQALSDAYLRLPAPSEDFQGEG